MGKKLVDCLQIWGLEKDFIVFLDGSVGFGLTAKPLDVTCWDDDRINRLAAQTAHFLNGISPGVEIQFVQDISGGNSERLQKHAAIAGETADSLARDLCTNRIKRFREMNSAGLLPVHTLNIFVRRKPTESIFGKPKLFWSKDKIEQKSEETLQREITLTQSLLDNISSGLKSLGVECTQIGGDQVLDYIYKQWNPTRSLNHLAPDPLDVRDSLLFTDAIIKDNGFSLGTQEYRVISLKMLPEHTFASMSQVLRNLPFNSRLFLTVSVQDQQKELEQLQTQRRLAFSMARGKKTGVSDLESESKLKDLETLLEEMISSGEKVFNAGLNVVLRSADPFLLDQMVSETLMAIRELSGAEAMEESLVAFDIFQEIAAPNARCSERTKKIKTTTLCDLLPLFGPWMGHDKPSILLRSTMGTLIGFDPLRSEHTNYNQIVSGGSGSGKSYLTNILLLQMLNQNPKAFIIDIGGSYKKLCDNLSGQYIPLGVTKDSINPFDLGPNESAPSNTQIKFLVGLVEMMTKEDGDSGLKRLERAQIEEAIQKVYETSPASSLGDLQKLLLGNEDIEVRRLGRVLSPWCGNSPYGQFVDRPTTIQLRKPIVCFDLKGMENSPDLQAVCLYIITNFVWQEVQKGDREQPKFLVFDECWKLLENEAGATFIGEAFRTFRKYKASAIAISQNIDDFAKSKVASAILSNSSIKWILMQKGADQARLKEVLQLNENEMNLIANLYQERGFYSQAFLMAQDERAVVAIEATPLEYWIATTDPRDLSVIDRLTKENPTFNSIKTLKEAAKRFPNGVAVSEANNEKNI